MIQPHSQSWHFLYQLPTPGAAKKGHFIFTHLCPISVPSSSSGLGSFAAKAVSVRIHAWDGGLGPESCGSRDGKQTQEPCMSFTWNCWWPCVLPVTPTSSGRHCPWPLTLPLLWAASDSAAAYELEPHTGALQRMHTRRTMTSSASQSCFFLSTYLSFHY